MQEKKIVLLAADGASSRWLYHSIKSSFPFTAVIIEQPISKKTLFINRIKKIGLFKVLSQAAFSLLVVPVLKWTAKSRRAALIEKYQLKNDDFPNDIIRVASVNEDACLQSLQKIQPDIVLVNGTRIIQKKILAATNAVFVNMHVGITPWYRGSHGGYWAIRNKDGKNFGTTLHLVDQGVDTGAVLKQVFASPDLTDNFTTYPILQAAIGIDAMHTLLPQLISGAYQAQYTKEKGRLYYQPGIFEYLLNKTK